MKNTQLRALIREQVKSILKEDNNLELDLSTWKIGDTVEFSNGEVWKVAKPGYKKSTDSIFLAPFNSIAKNGHISMPIEFSKDFLLNRNSEVVDESVIKEKVKKALTERSQDSFADYYSSYGRDVKAAAVFLDQTIESAGIEVTEELFDAITDLIDEVRADQDAEI